MTRSCGAPLNCIAAVCSKPIGIVRNIRAPACRQIRDGSRPPSMDSGLIAAGIWITAASDFGCRYDPSSNPTRKRDCRSPALGL